MAGVSRIVVFNNTFNRPALVRSPLFTFQFEYVITSFFVFVSPDHMGLCVPWAHAYTSLSLFWAGTAPTMLYLFCPVWRWHAAHPVLGLARFSTPFFNFGPLFCNPSTIKAVIESFHRLPRSKSLAILWSFRPFGLFKTFGATMS